MKVIQKRRKKIGVKTNCIFIKEGRQPDYKKPDELRVYLTERGRILPITRTGLTAKTQRQLTKAIKRARHLGLLPFIVKPD